MKIAPVVVAGGLTSASSAIDRKIQALIKRKHDIVGKIMAVIQGDDEQKIKEKKIEAMRMELQLIDLEIARLRQKKADQEKGKRHVQGYESDKLPPSISDLIHPGPGARDSKKTGLDVKV